MEPLTDYDKTLAAQGALTPSGAFRNLFSSAAAASEALASFKNLCRKPQAECSTPIEDRSFPASDAETVVVVARVFAAIADWSYILEWKSALTRDAKNRVVRALRRSDAGAAEPDSESLRPPPEELRRILSPVDVQQQRILGQVPSDQTVEWISWGIVVRCCPCRGGAEDCAEGRLAGRHHLPAGTHAAAMLMRGRRGLGALPLVLRPRGCRLLRPQGAFPCAAAPIVADCVSQHSKQLVKSLLTAGDGWTLRIVNYPRKEFRAKGNNRRINAAKERQRHGHALHDAGHALDDQSD